MITERLATYLSSFEPPLSDEFKQALGTRLTLLSLPEHYQLVSAPHVADHAYFLESGLAMAYRYNEGKREVSEFWKAGQVMLIMKSFFDQKPSIEYLELMTKSDVLTISRESLMELFNQFNESHALYRNIMNQCYEHAQQRIRDLRVLPTVVRHRKLLTEFPQLEQLVPQDTIASYLGVTPQSLSRIRRKRSAD